MSSEAQFVHFLHALQQHRGHYKGRHSRVLEGDNQGAHEIFQTSPFNALMAGAYDGKITFGELRKHGDFGVGTFNSLDGELIALEGEFYQVKEDGIVYAVADAQKTPFAVIQFFKPDFRREITQSIGYEQFKTHLQALLPAKNVFYALRVDGFFTSVKVRSAPRQTPPYVPFLDAMKIQTVFDLRDVQGTLLGFRFPDYTQGIGIPGYHLHFISADRKAGGHILDLHLKSGTLTVEHTAEFYLELPWNSTLPDAGPSAELKDKIHKVEG